MFLLAIYPPMLKALSDGAELAGIQSYFFAFTVG